MRFEHEVQEQTFYRVEEYLRELFDEPYHEPETDHFYVRYGTTVLEISVEPYGPEEAVVTVMSYCVQDVEVSEELLLGLLELNHTLLFGSFSLVGSDIFLAYSLFGHSLQRRNLLGAIAAVATLADDYDDRIVEKYGGQTALEKIQDTGGRRRRTESGTEAGTEVEA
jgi:type III secretion system-like peptide-binding chaperone